MSNLVLTVVRGLMSASLRACNIASIDGLHMIDDFGSSTPGWGSARCFMKSKILTSLAGMVAGDVGFNVSKHKTPSKQSSIPSHFRALEAWSLSPFVNTWYHNYTIN
jgi:hypothetical protein